jgi:hypothetical protein
LNAKFKNKASKPKGASFLQMEREKAEKALRLNGAPMNIPAASIATKEKQTFKIKRVAFNGSGRKLKGASSIIQQMKREKEMAEKALRLNGV